MLCPLDEEGLMKLLFLVVFFSLICVSCGKGGRDGDVENADQTAVEEQPKPAPEPEFTITHQADNDEDVLISYRNPNNGKAVSRFEIDPGSCFKFSAAQFQFIKNIKFGVGGPGLLQDNTGDVYNVVCGSILEEDKEEGHRDRPYYSDEELSSCGDFLGSNSYEIKDEGGIIDKYVLYRSEKNTSANCQSFEAVLESSIKK